MWVYTAVIVVVVIVIATSVVVFHVIVMGVVVRLVGGRIVRLEGITGLMKELQTAVLQQVFIHVLVLRQKRNADYLAWHIYDVLVKFSVFFFSFNNEKTETQNYLLLSLFIIITFSFFTYQILSEGWKVPLVLGATYVFFSSRKTNPFFSFSRKRLREKR